MAPCHTVNLSLEAGNKALLIDDSKRVLCFYSHTKYINEHEQLEDQQLELDRRSFSNLSEEAFCFKGLGCELAGVDMSEYIDKTFESSEALYQANKFQDSRDAWFVATRPSSLEQAFAGRGQLPLLQHEVDEFEKQGVEITWYDLTIPRTGFEERRCNGLKKMLKTRPDALVNEQGHVAVRIALTRAGYFEELGLRIMWAILLEKFVLGGGAAPVAARSLRAVANISYIHGIVEVNRGCHPDPTWTDEHGEGFNILGKMLFHLVEGLRIMDERGEDDMMQHLQFHVLLPHLRGTKAKELYRYSDMQ